MTAGPVTVSSDQRRQPFEVVGEHITALVAGEQTSSYEIFHQFGAEGTGPMPHLHPWDETFYVLNGEITFGIEGEETIAAQGTLVHLPGGTAHWFRFGTGGGEMLSITSGKTASQVFSDADRETELEKLAAVGERYGVTVAAPPDWVVPSPK
jgi:quercetin dioxygenase-like cupin family protein